MFSYCLSSSWKCHWVLLWSAEKVLSYVEYDASVFLKEASAYWYSCMQYLQLYYKKDTRWLAIFVKFENENLIFDNEIDAHTQNAMNVNRNSSSQQEMGATRDQLANRLAYAYGLVEWYWFRFNILSIICFLIWIGKIHMFTTLFVFLLFLLLYSKFKSAKKFFWKSKNAESWTKWYLDVLLYLICM